MYTLDMVYTAYCHGEKEEVRLPEYWLAQALDFNLCAGTAFNTKRLEADRHDD
jgi:hypothetical protein